MNATGIQLSQGFTCSHGELLKDPQQDDPALAPAPGLPECRRHLIVAIIDLSGSFSPLPEGNRLHEQQLHGMPAGNLPGQGGTRTVQTMPGGDEHPRSGGTEQRLVPGIVRGGHAQPERDDPVPTVSPAHLCRTSAARGVQTVPAVSGGD